MAVLSSGISIADPVRLVATDLDGTLLRTDRTLSPRTVATLAGCSAAGIEVVFVTARPPRVVGNLARMSGVVRTAICSNGTIVHDFEADTSTYAHAFTVEQARELAEEVGRILPGAALAVETGEVVWRGPGYRMGTLVDPGRRLADPWDSVWDKVERVVKLLVRSPERRAGPMMSADSMLATVAAGLTLPAELSHSGGRGLLEIAPAGATKAGTLERYCAGRGIEAREVLAFGDMPNDLPMLAWAGTSCAVSNAHPAVLAAVDGRTASNDQDGVAAVLEGLLAATLR